MLDVGQWWRGTLIINKRLRAHIILISRAPEPSSETTITTMLGVDFLLAPRNKHNLPHDASLTPPISMRVCMERDEVIMNFLIPQRKLG